MGGAFANNRFRSPSRKDVRNRPYPDCVTPQVTVQRIRTRGRKTILRILPHELIGEPTSKRNAAT